MMGYEKQLQRSNSVPDLDFRMQYGSIVGMTDVYNRDCANQRRAASSRLLRERVSLVKFADVADTMIFDPELSAMSMSCSSFNYDASEEDKSLQEEKSKKKAKDESIRKLSRSVEDLSERLDKVAKDSQRDLKKIKKKASEKKKEIRKETKKKVAKEREMMLEVRSRQVDDLQDINQEARKESEERRKKMQNEKKTSHGLQEECLLIVRKTKTLQKQVGTLERDNAQLTETKDLVSAQISRFESLKKEDSNSTKGSSYQYDARSGKRHNHVGSVLASGIYRSD
jgi:chromosome segregation ATPase